MAKKKKPEMPDVGDQAPRFEGVTQTGETISLDDYRGRRIALYFYPKDDTSGCTKQACNLRDEYGYLQDDDIAVIGVSADPVESHKKFADKYELPFPLISDPDHRILEAYGVWGKKNMYGRKFMGISRTTFLIDEEGMIKKVIKRPKVKEHAAEIMDKFGE